MTCKCGTYNDELVRTKCRKCKRHLSSYEVASEAQPPQAGLPSASCSAPKRSGGADNDADTSCRSASAKRSAADVKRAARLAVMAYNLMEVAQFLLKAADAAPAVGQQVKSEARPKAKRAQARNAAAHPQPPEK